jgi:hypothetical protein
MERTQIYLTEEEKAYFRRVAYERKITTSQAIREILDKHIQEQEKEHGSITVCPGTGVL